MGNENQTRQAARLIIPVWGDTYVSKLTSVTLPAVLAPGNLPALCETFGIELVIVTESRLFDSIRKSRSFLAAEKICAVRLVPLDDLMTDRSIDYGMLLTYALFRGFADLGERMTETYLLFLNTDFIISDGSLRHLGRLMHEGERVIHAPSFRVILEEVWPKLQARVDHASGTLAIPPREMARMALANRHRTVQARTVNQRLCHQTYQDQFYWYVDDETLIGYQWPVALVAIKPERLVAEPVMFWDFGFIPEAAPTAQPRFIGDSDDFFMIELQTRSSGQDMIRLGGASVDEIVTTLALYATKEHRESGQQLLVIHAGDAPANLENVVAESRVYMAEILRRLPAPVSHINHPRLGQWFEETKRRRRGAPDASERSGVGTVPAASDRFGFAIRALFILQRLHQALCGAAPKVNRFHPLWMDFFSVVQKLEYWRVTGQGRVLWISSIDSPFDALLGRRTTPIALLMPEFEASTANMTIYDACLCELSLPELLRLKPLYAKIRPLIRDGGEVVVSVKPNKGIFDGAATVLEETEYPDVDVSELHFYGTAATALLRKIALPGLRPIPTRPVLRGLIVSFLIVAAPLVWLANIFAARRDSRKFSPNWTTALINIIIQRPHDLR